MYLKNVGNSKMYIWSYTNPHIFKFVFSHLLLVNNVKGHMPVNSTLTIDVCSFLTEHINVIHAYLMIFLTRNGFVAEVELI